MKYALVLLPALACCGAAAQQQPIGDLRQAVRRYHATDSSPPRQLSPLERAELRKQLAEFKSARPRPASNNDAPLEPQPRTYSR